jgi:AraC family transcriptional regulator
MRGGQDADSVWRVEKQSQVPGFSPIASTGDARWDGMAVEVFSFDQPTSTPATCFTNLCVSMLRAGRASLWTEHRRNPRTLGPGAIAILPAEMVLGGGNPEPSGWTSIHLKPSLLAAAAQDLVNPDRIEIVSEVVFREPQIERLGLALEGEVRAGFTSGRLFGESVGTAVAAHLLAHYAVKPGVAREYHGGMPPHRLRRTIEYIDANLGCDIGLAELAAVAEMSQWHFCRMFKRSTGMSPHQYLMRARIAAAKLVLAKPEPRLAEIAKELGFADQSHFTAVFRRFTGMTPKRYLSSR